MEKLNNNFLDKFRKYKIDQLSHIRGGVVFGPSANALTDSASNNMESHESMPQYIKEKKYTSPGNAII